MKKNTPHIFLLFVTFFYFSSAMPIELTTATVDSNCGLANGQASVTVIGGGIEPITYLWSNGATTATTSNLFSGIYTVAVTNGVGVMEEATVIVSDNEAPIVSIINATNPTTVLGADGTATATTAGGIGPFTYLWSNGETTQTATSLPSGLNTVLVMALNGCQSGAQVILTAPLSCDAMVTFTTPTPICIDAGIQTGLGNVTAAGGVFIGPGVTDDGNEMTYSFNPTTAGIGSHTITYTDINGCTSVATIEVVALPTVTFTAPADVCLNAETQTGLSGGTPAVSIISTTVVLNLDYEDVFGPGSGVTGGEIVFDPSGAMVSTNLIFFGNANGNVAPLINATASGATITLDFENGPIGTFVADAPIIGATGHLNFISGTDLIIDGDDFSFVLATGTATTETLGSAIYAGPGVTNEASGTLYSFDPAVAGAGTHTITYTFTNENGCTDTASNTIEVFALPTITFTAPEDVCVNAGVQTGLGNATPTGGIYTGLGVTDDGNGMAYSFDPTIAGIGTHTITYEFTDANGCSNTASNTIEVFAIDDPSFNYDASVYTGDDADPTPTITGLAGGAFSADAGLVLNPTTGTIDVSTTTPGTYVVTYTTAGNCMDSSSVMVTVNVGLLTQVDAAFCGTNLVTFDQNFTCEVVPDATQYDFQITNQATSMVTISSNTEALNSLAMANLFDFGATYDVRVRATVNGVTGPYGMICTLTAPSSTLSLETFENNSNFSMYPNPSSKNITIKSTIDHDFRIVNLLGQTVRIFIVNANIETTFFIGDLSDGMYLVISRNSTNISSQKLIIKK